MYERAGKCGSGETKSGPSAQPASAAVSAAMANRPISGAITMLCRDGRRLLRAMREDGEKPRKAAAAAISTQPVAPKMPGNAGCPASGLPIFRVSGSSPRFRRAGLCSSFSNFRIAIPQTGSMTGRDRLADYVVAGWMMTRAQTRTNRRSQAIIALPIPTCRKRSTPSPHDQELG
jgi:hypothetical protein